MATKGEVFAQSLQQGSLIMHLENYAAALTKLASSNCSYPYSQTTKNYIKVIEIDIAALKCGMRQDYKEGLKNVNSEHTGEV